jgi:ferrous iron transport protein B
LSPKAEHTLIKVALIGNPNSGKSSLFNAITGLHQRTGNYSGVTVDRYEGFTYTQEGDKKYKFQIVDLPGVYSLYPKSADEEVACKALLEEKDHPDVVVIVADAANLKRNLLLATQVLDLKFPTVLVLNMIDEANAQNIVIDSDGLAEAFGVELVKVDSRNKTGLEELKKALLKAKKSEAVFYDIKHPALQASSYREHIVACLGDTANTKQFEESDKLYRFRNINYLMSKYLTTPEVLSAKKRTALLDRFFTHKIFGYLILLLLLLLVFQLVFYISEAPMNWIEQFFMQAGALLGNTLPEGVLSDLVINGVIPGLSGVLMFIPQIAFLFLIIGILEDTGYMARASFIMDRMMRPFGLNGRSVIPLISGTACAVPSIMATRAISNTRERLITIFILPLISCSARLPVYTLILATLYPEHTVLGFFNSRGLALFVLYMLGFVASFATAFVLKKLIKTKESSFFIMEMPVYRSPQLRNLLFLMYNKVKVFVKEAGKIILAISIVLWFLSSHGYSDAFQELKEREHRLQLAETESNNAQLQAIQTQKLEQSYIGQLGHFIEPAIAPLGFDWKIGIALLTSFAAREVFVGTMATIYQSGGTDNYDGIRQKLLQETTVSGEPRYTAAVCWSLLLFYAFALQCMSTIAVVKRETKSWFWVTVQFVFMSALAYGSSFAAYQIVS